MDAEPRDSHIVDDPDAIQPIREGEATSYADPSDDPAQAEWEHTEALDAGAPLRADGSIDTATGADPDELASDEEQIPRIDQPGAGLQPESQADDPIIAELGEDGEGDLAPEDI
ncbi:hypothetical protein GCM10022219_24490 [Microbacterium oryzae]|uniref:Sugar ABC transporter ATPase n=1 Tax=Microbacterium oryzae TaxID=743009 RepID=A0A6I6E024_9MICO|nr:sugar ABC transporter ATPase [Microbacterium oryzae]QGU27239.1 sugar ABC transporter ATPase [Microbacterium oryzae]